MTIRKQAKGDPFFHYWLSMDMAQRLGVDLWEARSKGEISDEMLQEAFERCRDCNWERNNLCEYWLKQQGADIDEAPRQCENKEIFEKLLEERKTRQAEQEEAAAEAARYASYGAERAPKQR